MYYESDNRWNKTPAHRGHIGVKSFNNAVIVLQEKKIHSVYVYTHIHISYIYFEAKHKQNPISSVRTVER